MSDAQRDLVAGLVAFGVYGALVALAGLKWWVPLLPAALVYWGLRLTPPRRLEDHEIQVTRNLTRASLREALAAGRARAGELRDLAARIDGDEVGNGVRRLADATDAVFSRLEKDPKQYASVQMFESVVLEQALKAVRGYTTLATAPGSSRHQRQLDKFERMLPSLVEEFERLGGPDVSRAAARMSTALDVLGRLGHDDEQYLNTPRAEESRIVEGGSRE